MRLLCTEVQPRFKSCVYIIQPLDPIFTCIDNCSMVTNRDFSREMEASLMVTKQEIKNPKMKVSTLFLLGSSWSDTCLHE